MAFYIQSAVESNSVVLGFNKMTGLFFSMATVLFYCSVLIYILNWTEHSSFEQERNSKLNWNIFNFYFFF